MNWVKTAILATKAAVLSYLTFKRPRKLRRSSSIAQGDVIRHHQYIIVKIALIHPKQEKFLSLLNQKLLRITNQLAFCRRSTSIAVVLKPTTSNKRAKRQLSHE